MKKLLILSALLVFAFACKKNEASSDFYAIKDGTKWNSDYSWSTFSTANKNMIIVANKKISGAEENIYLLFKTSDVLNSINHFKSERAIIIGGDASTDQYSIDTTANNFILISSLDTLKKQVSGTFSVTLFRAPDKYLNFTNGEFNLSFKEENNSK